MKIVFVLENYIPHIGGVEILFKYICESFAKNNEVIVVTHRFKDTKKEETINGVKVIRINVPAIGARYFFTFFALPTLLRVCKDADIIHTTTYNGAPPASFISRLYKKPSAITIHEVIGENWAKLLEMSWLEGKLHQFLEWLVVNLKFDKYVCVSNSTKNDFEKANKRKKGTVIYNGIDYDFWNPKNYDGNKVRKALEVDKNFVCFFYGRPGPSKGFEFLVQAMPKIIKSLPKAKLVAILSKDKAYERRYNKIIKMISDLGITDSVKILAPVKREELPNYVDAADCVVVPSLTEGFGFTVGESCAMGKPVVTCNTTSIPEVVSGEHIMVKPRSPEGIADAVLKVYHKKTTKKPLKKFTWEECISNYKKLYKEMIKNK
jgi:glycosyltransferase involved in cell wall biosynthesis